MLHGAIGLDKQNNNFPRASRFFLHFFAVTANYDFKLPNFTFCGGSTHKTTTFFFFSWTLIQSFSIQIQKKQPTFDELNEIE